MPMSSRSVRPAGNRHSWGDTSIALPARHAGYLPGMGPSRARYSPGGGAGGQLRAKRQVRWALPAAAGARNVRALMLPSAPAAAWPLYVRVTRGDAAGSSLPLTAGCQLAIDPGDRSPEPDHLGAGHEPVSDGAVVFVPYERLHEGCPG